MFNPSQIKPSMRQAVEKIVTELKKSGITFTPQEGPMNNVGFRKGNKLVLMSQHSFYRYAGTGIAVRVHFKEKQPEPIIVPVTDEMYMMNYIKPIVEVLIEKAE